MCSKNTSEAPAGIRRQYSPWCRMWLKKVCAEEIICLRERDAGRWILEVVIPSFGSLWVPLVWSYFRVCPWVGCSHAEVNSGGKACAETSTSQQINAVHFIWPLRSGHSFCLPLLNRALTHSQKQFRYLHRARCQLWFLSLFYGGYLTPYLSFSNCQ